MKEILETGHGFESRTHSSRAKRRRPYVAVKNEARIHYDAPDAAIFIQHVVCHERRLLCTLNTLALRGKAQSKTVITSIALRK